MKILRIMSETRTIIIYENSKIKKWQKYFGDISVVMASVITTIAFIDFIDHHESIEKE